MCPSESLIAEIEILRRLRRHRADRAERALSAAKKAQRTVLRQIEQAEEALEQSRREEAQQCAQLLKENQGQVMTLQALKAWSTQEHNLSASTRREESQLQALHVQKDQQTLAVGDAQKHVTRCLLEVEKLQALSGLLAQEQA